jgi:hypothetical protein
LRRKVAGESNADEDDDANKKLINNIADQQFGGAAYIAGANNKA